jgi:hypothetical protein
MSDGMTDAARGYHTPPPVQQPTNPIMRYFAYAHLPERLQAVSRPFGELAQLVNDTLPDGPEKSVALRKLLEAKDAAVRTLV